ncbi:chromate transporter [Yeguia hominis]|uniref:Chromate transporter n=1 Tax=Yeguia hominis TaxID=2763662 RepID=A0A926D7L1_9FIRM|nr:chromate transporter [Yeguia hominis]MBC8532812.1 chromate transporter [Yeguia hominis]
MIYLRLFWEFFQAGLFAIGGGMATLPFLYDISDRTGWYTHAQLADMIAVSESTPGPVGVNMATYVGFTSGGVLGAGIATLGLVAPSIIVILMIAGFLKAFRENRFVNSAFYGLRPASVGLIAAAVVPIFQISILNLETFSITHEILQLFQWPYLLLAVLVFFLMRKFSKIHPIVFIGASAVAGIVFGLTGLS